MFVWDLILMGIYRFGDWSFCLWLFNLAFVSYFWYPLFGCLECIRKSRDDNLNPTRRYPAR